MKAFNPKNWYWVVNNSATQVFSSASGDYVPVGNVPFQLWLTKGNRASHIANEAELGDVLAQYDISPVNAGVLDEVKGKKVDRLPIDVILKVLFNHENRIRALAGQPAVNQAQFRNALKNLL